MTPVFADTAFYIALVNQHDALHDRAAMLSRELHRQAVTTEYVLLEVANYLSRTADRPALIALLRDIDADPNTLVVPSGPDLFAEGRALFAQRLDKDWSLTDCISFVAMRRRRLTDALTSDHHFEQAGFSILLGPQAPRPRP